MKLPLISVIVMVAIFGLLYFVIKQLCKILGINDE